MLNRSDSKGTPPLESIQHQALTRYFAYFTDIMFLLERVSASFLLDSNLINVCSLKRSVCFTNIAVKT